MIEFTLIANTIFFIVVLAFLYGRGFLNVYSGIFVYIAFHFITFVQRPIAVYLLDIRSEFVFMNYMPTDDVFVQTILIADIGLVSFLLGFLFVLRFQPIVPHFQPPQVSTTDRRAVATAFVILLPMMIYSFYLAFTTRLTSSPELLGNWAGVVLTVDPLTGTTLFSDNTAYLVFARNLALPFSAYFMFINRGHWWSVIPLAFCAFIALHAGGGRWEMVISSIVVVVMMLYWRRRKLPSAQHCVVLVFVLLIFMAAGRNRGIVTNFLETGTFEWTFDIENSSFGQHPDFANFEFLTYVVGKVPDVSKTWSYFTQYLGLFTQPIPRVFWPDKPVGSPIVLVNLQAYGQFFSRTTSLVGDGWISLGYPGVILTLSLVGAGYGWLYKRFCTTSFSIYFFCGYLWIEALLIQWARDGGPKISEFFFFCLAPLVLAWGVRYVIGGPRGHAATHHIRRDIPLRSD